MKRSNSHMLFFAIGFSLFMESPPTNTRRSWKAGRDF